MGSIFNQSNRFNEFQTSSRDCKINGEFEDISMINDGLQENLTNM